MTGLMFLFIVTIILFIISYNEIGRDILAPSVIVCAVFVVSELFALFSVKTWDIEYSFKAAEILILGISIFVVVDILFHKTLKNRKIVFRSSSNRNKHLDNSGNILVINKVILYCIILINIAFIPIYYYSLMRLAVMNGLGGSLGVALKSLSYDTARNTDTVLGAFPTLLSRFCMVTGYVLLFYYHHNKAEIKRHPELSKYNKRNRLLIIPAICYMIASLFQGSRIQILLFLFYYYTVSYISTQKSGGHWSFKDSRKYTRYGIVIALIALPMFYFVLGLVGRSNANLSMLDYLAIYAGGSIQQFNQFVKAPVKNTLWGKECFYSIYNFLWKIGLRSEYVSPHLEFRNLYRIGTDGSRWYSGNVYTFFRSPLSDFGLGGMVFMTFLFALFYSFIYHNTIKKKSASEYSIIIYAYLLAQLSMVSIANQLTIMISVYGMVNIVLFIVMIYVINRFCKKISVVSTSKSLEENGFQPAGVRSVDIRGIKTHE